MKSIKEICFPVFRRLIPRKWFFSLSEIYFSVECLIKYGDPHHFHSVAIEVSTYCNRKCYYCPNSIHDTPKEFMEREVFLKALERLSEIKFSGIIDYSLYNEPLMDDRLPEFVKLTKEALPKAIIRIYTNGDFLTPELAQALIDAGALMFSITQHDKDEKAFMKRIQPLLDKFPNRIVLNCLHDAGVSNRGGAIEIENYSPPDKCITADRNLTITRKGDVLLCCNDYFQKHVFGNIMTESIKQIRNKDEFKKVRKEVRNGITNLKICRECLAKDLPKSDAKHSSHIKEFK